MGRGSSKESGPDRVARLEAQKQEKTRAKAFEKSFETDDVSKANEKAQKAAERAEATPHEQIAEMNEQANQELVEGLLVGASSEVTPTEIKGFPAWWQKREQALGTWWQSKKDSVSQWWNEGRMAKADKKLQALEAKKQSAGADVLTRAEQKTAELERVSGRLAEITGKQGVSAGTREKISGEVAQLRGLAEKKKGKIQAKEIDPLVDRKKKYEEKRDGARGELSKRIEQKITQVIEELTRQEDIERNLDGHIKKFEAEWAPLNDQMARQRDQLVALRNEQGLDPTLVAEINENITEIEQRRKEYQEEKSALEANKKAVGDRIEKLYKQYHALKDQALEVYGYKKGADKEKYAAELGKSFGEVEASEQAREGSHGIRTASTKKVPAQKQKKGEPMPTIRPEHAPVGAWQNILAEHGVRFNIPEELDDLSRDEVIDLIDHDARIAILEPLEAKGKQSPADKKKQESTLRAFVKRVIDLLFGEQKASYEFQGRQKEKKQMSSVIKEWQSQHPDHKLYIDPTYKQERMVSEIGAKVELVRLLKGKEQQPLSVETKTVLGDFMDENFSDESQAPNGQEHVA